MEETDIVYKLREWAKNATLIVAELCTEAADEIERLREFAGDASSGYRRGANLADIKKDLKGHG